VPPLYLLALLMPVLVGFGCAPINVVGDPSSNNSREAHSTVVSGAADKLAKRAGPEEVAQVTIGNIKFVVIPWGKSRGLGQNGGYIAALDATTGTELWILKVYEVKYDLNKEQDVQDVFIESMSKTRSGDNLEIRDEEGRVYLVDTVTRAVIAR
jgi:PQQ enzyme-like repeat protein